MPAPEGKCWLCGKYGKLTKEHIPPERAFNNREVLLAKVDEMQLAQGRVGWTHDRTQHGYYVRSLCGDCNNAIGRKYGGAYVDLVANIAERIGDVQDYHQMTVSGIKRPLAILKQIVAQFVTANGAAFVRANNWVEPFVRDTLCRQLPPEIRIYLYASNRPRIRTTGIGAQFDLTTGRSSISADFVAWPLGKVLAFDPLDDHRLTPVHEWVQYPFDYKGTVTVDLSVNPVVTESPRDFRDERQVRRDQVGDSNTYRRPSDETAKAVFNKAIALSGQDEQTDEFIVVGSDKTRFQE
jgi:hypothetical protein